MVNFENLNLKNLEAAIVVTWMVEYSNLWHQIFWNFSLGGEREQNEWFWAKFCRTQLKLNPNLKPINSRKRMKVFLKILRGRIPKPPKKWSHFRCILWKSDWFSHLVLGFLIDYNFFCAQNSGFWVIFKFKMRKSQFFPFSGQFPPFRNTAPFSQHCPLFATLFRRVKVLRKGVPPVYLFQFTTFSRIHFDWTFYFANILRIHFPFCEQTMNQLKVPLNSLFFSQISFEFTLSFANKLRINYLFRKIATYSANIPWIHY